MKKSYETSDKVYLMIPDMEEIMIVFKHINKSIGENNYSINIFMKTEDKDYEIELNIRTLATLNKIKRVAEDFANSFYGGIPRKSQVIICRIEYIHKNPKLFVVEQNPKSLRWSAVK